MLKSLQLTVPGTIEQFRMHAPRLRRVHIRAQAMSKPAVDWLLRQRGLFGQVLLNEALAPVTMGQLQELHPRLRFSQNFSK